MKTSDQTLPLTDSLVRALDINCRITHYLVENLDPNVWHTPTLDGKGENVRIAQRNVSRSICVDGNKSLN